MTAPSWPHPDFATANGIYCSHCGATPAAAVNFRAHRGLIVFMQFRTARGPFCRDCGLATFRRMTGDSMWQGWWGLLSFVINPITILSNLAGLSTVQRLGPPIPGSPYRPLDPGRPLFQRPQMLGLLAPVVAIGLLVFGAASGSSSGRSASTGALYTPAPRYTPPTFSPQYTTAPPTTTTDHSTPDSAKAGDCVWNRHRPDNTGDDDNPEVLVVSCGDPNAQAKVLGRIRGGGGISACQPLYPDTDAAYTSTHTGGMGDLLDYTLCLHNLK
jgi:hypothetical protein